MRVFKVARKTAEERFWAKVDKAGPVPAGLDSCWLWRGARSRGYGDFQLATKKRVKAHRYALELKLGRPLAPNMDCMHACDVRHCVNPAHLSEGTRQQNVRDAVRKGRWLQVRGEHNGQAKLDPAAVLFIRAARGITKQRALARRFGVSQHLIHRIQLGKSWTHVPT